MGDPNRDKELKLAQALGRVKVAYIALSGARTLLTDTELEERAARACREANDLTCEILLELANTTSATLDKPA